MNDYDYPGTGPCEDYEFEIAELLDGELSPERARIVSIHVTNCLRCRAWRNQYVAFDRRLAAALPRPVLPADFALRLRGRLEATAHQSEAALRDDENRDYTRAISALKSGWKLPALLNGVAAAAVAVCAWLLVTTVMRHWHLEDLGDVRTQATIFSALSGAVIAAALGWSFTRNPWPGFLPRI